jgi:branched-chain amino acid transport system substrate-binding protein
VGQLNRRTRRGRQDVIATRAIGAVALASVACGTRVTERSASDGGSGSIPAPTAAPVAAIQTPPAVGPPSGTGEPPAAGTNSASGTQPGPQRSTTPTSTVSDAAVTGRTLEGGGGTTGGSKGAGAPSPTPVPGGERAQVPAPGATTGRSPVILASVGHYSGVPGSTAVPPLQGAQTWVQYINQKGGLNGHPVRLLVYDDGADPARRKAQLADAIERQHAIGFLMNVEALTGNCCIDYITSKRVPVIPDGNEPWVYDSPMYFPFGSAGVANTYLGLAAAAMQSVPSGKTKLGTLVCVEGQQCSDIQDLWTKWANGVGMKAVYSGKASLAQPDFTAECLAAKNAGAEVLAIIFDFNSQQRVAASCARQGYHPAFTHIPTGVGEKFKADPNMDGYVAGSNVFPWFQSGTPATDDYQQAMKTYGGSVPPGVGPAQGWTAGKLMERAGASLPEPPTSEALLQGLWTIKNDSLGGLTQPLSFFENKPSTPVACWYNITIRNRSWVSPDGFKFQCRSVPDH